MGLSFFLHILLVVGVGLLFYLFSSYLHSSCWREEKLYMGTSFGDAVFFRCRARWWGLFKNIDVKNPALQFFFSSPPIRRRRECKGARGRKEKGIYLRSTLDRVSFQQKVFFFLLAPASMWIAPAFPLWLFYIKLQFARLDSCFPTRLGIPEWLTAIYLGTGLPILAYPDRAPIQSSSCILNVLIALYSPSYPIWDCVLLFDFALPRLLRSHFFSSSLYKHRRSFRSIALSGAEIWQW